jgi:hypothetical protein
VGRNIFIIAVAFWLVLLAALFLSYQFGPFLMENKVPVYLPALLKVAAMLFSAAALGLNVLGARIVSLPAALRGLAVGLGIFALAGFLAGSTGLLNPYTVWLIVAVAAAASYRQVARLARALAAFRPGRLHPLESMLLTLVAISLLVALINCLSPVTANDALVYHINLPKIYSDAGRMVYLPFNVYANMPHYGEVIFSLFFSAAGETGVTLFYFMILAAASLAVYVLVTRWAPRLFAILAAGAFLVQPLVLDYRVVCNIDILLAFVYLAAIDMVLDWKPGKAGWRLVIGASGLAGLMMGIKYTGIAPAVSLLILALAERRRGLAARHIAAGIAVAVLVVAPWLVRQAVNTGNPFYPMLESRLGGANWDTAEQERLVSWQRSMGMGREVTDYLALPINVSTRGRPGLNYVHFDGTISPVILILFPLVFLKRRRETTTLALLAAGLCVFWALVSQQLRFLLPALALSAALGAAGLAGAAGEEKAEVARPKAWVVLFILGLAFIQTASLAAPNQYGRPWLGDAVGERLRAALGLEPRDRFLERTVQPFNVYRQANAGLPAGERLFMVWENRAYYLDRPYFADSFFEASTLMRMVAAARDARALRDKIAGMGYRYVLVNDLLGEVFAAQYPPADVVRLRTFVDNYLEDIYSANRVTLYRMTPGPGR